MNNKQIALIVCVLIIAMMVGGILLGIAGHIPFLKGPLTFIIAILLLLFIVGFFAIIVKKR